MGAPSQEAREGGEGMKVDFFISMTPPSTTSQQKGAMAWRSKDGRQGVRFYKKKAAVDAENTFLSLLQPYAPEEPLEGAVALKIVFIWEWRKTEPKKNRVNGYRYKDKRPDASNIVKLVEDCMTTLRFWRDDSQVADLRVVKLWGDRPGVRIYASELEPIELKDAVEHRTDGYTPDLFDALPEGG